MGSTGSLRAVRGVVKILRTLHGGPSNRKPRKYREVSQAVLKHPWVLHVACARIAVRRFPEKTGEDHESGFRCADRMPWKCVSRCKSTPFDTKETISSQACTESCLAGPKHINFHFYLNASAKECKPVLLPGGPGGGGVDQSGRGGIFWLKELIKSIFRHVSPLPCLRKENRQLASASFRDLGTPKSMGSLCSGHLRPKR